MKRLLFALVLLFSIPFNSSCIVEITYKVEVTGSHCTWDKPKQATRGRTYKIKITPDDGYWLYVQEGVLDITVGDFSLELLGDSLYDQETHTLTIPGSYVTNKIYIAANADELQV